MNNEWSVKCEVIWICAILFLNMQVIEIRTVPKINTSSAMCYPYIKFSLNSSDEADVDYYGFTLVIKLMKNRRLHCSNG